MKYADIARSKFKSLERRIGALGIIGGLGFLNALVIWLMTLLEKRSCGALPIRIIDLELTFAAPRFNTLLGLSATGSCRGYIQWNFVTLDVLFPVCYALALCAAFLWMERQRRVNTDGSANDDPLPLRNDLFILAPLAAGAIDIVFENIPLWLAATLLGRGWSPESFVVGLLVLIGSLGAAIKWTLILVSVLAVFAELLSCSRGTVLRRLRFSAIAVVMGALPLLAIAQGQDILQRVVEGDEPAGRMAGALLALTFAATTVWYCGRKLVQIRFPGDPEPSEESWYAFFAEHIPRILGISVLALAGAAFARAGGALNWFAGAALAGYVAAFAAGRWWPALPRWIGAIFVHGYRKVITGFAEEIGSAVIAVSIGLVILYLSFRLEESTPRDFTLLRFTAWAFLAIAWAFYVYVYTRRGRIAAKQSKDNESEYSAELQRVEARAVSSVDASALGRAIKRGILAGVIASGVIVAIFTVRPVESARALGALVILSLAASSVVFYGSIAAWVYARYRLPVIPIAIAFAILFSVWNENHVIRKLDTGRDLVVNRQDIATRLSQWRPSDSPGVPTPVFLVAASGGGLRAAYWTATSLAAIQNRNHAFNRHLFAISSVSGGSLGAAVYSAIVKDVEGRDTTVTCYVNRSTTDSTISFGPYHDCVRNFMGQDFLSPVLAKMVGPDFIQLLFPVPVNAFDRSLALEGSWEKSYRDMTGLSTMSDGFLALSKDSGRATPVPALFFNSTHVETGKRFVTASLVRGDSTPPLGSSSRTMHDSRDLLDILQSDLPLSTAVHNSARFTYVSPPGRIQRSDSAEFGHLVDGGYFENSGLATLSEILTVIRASGAATAGHPRLIPVVLYLCNDPIPCKADGASDTVLTTNRAAVVEWAGPIRALFHTRDARGSLARADIADVDSVQFIQLNVCDSLLARDTTSREEPGLLGTRERREKGRGRVVSPPLGWLLSKIARDWMDASLTASPTAGDGESTPSRCRVNNDRAIQKIDSLLRLH